MFEDENDENPSERASDPARQAKEKSDEFRTHAELAAVFEGPRKFDARLDFSLSADVAREIQRTVAKLEKNKITDTPIIAEEQMPAAAEILKLCDTRGLPTNDYHIHRRPGELMIVRWLVGDQVETYYERLQAHFDAALEGFREEECSAKQWKGDEKTLAYLDALDKIELKMSDAYLRDAIRQHRFFVLSTQTADEMNIAYLADYILGVPAAELVGEASAPPENPRDRDLAWFFKLFNLRGIVENVERMCFFTFLQKTDEF